LKLKRMAEPRAKIEFQIKKELFEAIADNAVCSRCKVVPRKGPIYQSRTDINDILCEECYDEESYDIVYFDQCGTLEKTLYGYQVTSCKFRKNGCKVIQDLKNIEYHEEDCEFRDILCPYLFCKDVISFNALKEHFSQSHFDLDDDSKVDEIKGKIMKLEEPEIQEREEEGSRALFFYKQYEKLFILHVQTLTLPQQNSVVIWVQLYGSKFEAKNYNFTIKMGDSTHGQCMFKGAVKSLDDDKNEAFEKQYGLIVSFDFGEKFFDAKSSLIVEIEIEDLKPQEEQADYEEPMEADAATTATDDKEKDSKN